MTKREPAAKPAKRTMAVSVAMDDDGQPDLVLLDTFDAVAYGLSCRKKKPRIVPATLTWEA